MTTAMTLAQKYPILSSTAAVNVWEENLGGISLQDLPRATASLTGQYMVTGQENSSKSLEGIILYHNLLHRDRFAEAYDPQRGGRAPVCTSDDSIQGYGDPGIKCRTCPFRDKMEAGGCLNRPIILMALPGQQTPVVLYLNLTGIKTYKAYMRELSAAGVSYHQVISRLTLQQDGRAVRVMGTVPGWIDKATAPPLIDSDVHDMITRQRTFITQWLETQPLNTTPDQEPDYETDSPPPDFSAAPEPASGYSYTLLEEDDLPIVLDDEPAPTRRIKK